MPYSDLNGKHLDAVLGLKAISIRLPITWIDDLKALNIFTILITNSSSAIYYCDDL